MKKLLIYISIFAFVTTGCTKKLDVLPTQSIDEADAFTSDSKIKAALKGAYDAISSGSLLGGDLQLYSELLGADDEIRWVGTFNEPRELWRKDILVNNVYVTDTWTEAYRVTNICNNILSALNIVDANDRDQVEAEALFLRGVVLFELVKLYAKPYSAGNVSSNLGVQLVTVPTRDGMITEANYVPRSSVQETYDFILDDLTSAKSALPDENDVYATTFAASAFLSRVYLQMGDYEKARDEANTVINSGLFELAPTIQDAFNNSQNSSEDIFDMQVSEKDGANDMHLFWSTSDYGARDGDVEVEQKHLDLYDPADDRLQMFFYGIYTEKWQLQYKNIPVVRLAELYLTRAEANFRLGTIIGATPAEDLNFIRTRVNLPPTTPTLANIIFERRLELAFEGQRIHDIKRLKASVDGFPFDANELVFPIPIREINASKGVLIQNDGY